MPDPIPERLYDAALRVISRHPMPTDTGLLRAWPEAKSYWVVREIALEVFRQVERRGISKERV
jgi:hypothetical protein